MNISYKLSSSEAKSLPSEEKYIVEILLKAFSSRRYLDGEGREILRPGKDNIPARTLAVFKNISDYRDATRIYGLCRQSLFKSTVDNPVIKKEAIISGIVDSVKTGSPLTLFVPWGMRPSWNERREGRLLEEEGKALDETARKRETFSRAGIAAEVLIMGADTYATQVNGFSESSVSSYFDMLKTEAERRSVGKFTTWGALAAEDPGLYGELSEKYDDDTLRRIFPPEMIRKAVATASRRSSYTDPADIEKSGMEYLRQRCTEADFIMRKFNPVVKMSLVTPDRDSGVDRDLPRLYAVPKQMIYPWLADERRTNGNR